MSFGDILKSSDQGAKEKHVPLIEIDKCDSDEPNVVRVIVGKEVPHPNTVEHHIGWIELYGVKENGQVVCIGKASFEPAVAEPNARFIAKLGEFKTLYALEYCNIHGVWENSLEL